MSGDNLYPTIDSMGLEDIIKYLREHRNCSITIIKRGINMDIKEMLIKEGIVKIKSPEEEAKLSQ